MIEAARPVRTAAITNLGCKVNQSEMESAARLLRERGIRVVDGDAAARADLVLVNTCTVTATADHRNDPSIGVRPPRIDQRKPSMIPASGFNA